MWWTPWLWSFRMGGSILPSLAGGDPVKGLQTTAPRETVTRGRVVGHTKTPIERRGMTWRRRRLTCRGPGLPGAYVRAELPVLERVEADGERDDQAAVDVPELRPELDDVAVAELPEHALVPPGLAPVTEQREIERHPREQGKPLGQEACEPAQESDSHARLMRLDDLRPGRVADVPVAAQQRAAEILLEHADDGSVGVEHLVAPAKLEDRLRLDHEDVVVGVRGEPEADVLLDLELLLLHVEQRSPLVGRPRRGDADAVLIADRLENLLDEESIGRLELAENGLHIGRNGHSGIVRGRGLRPECLRPPLVVGRRHPEDHPVTPRPGGDGSRGGDVDVRLGQLLGSVGDRADAVFTLDEKRPLDLAQRHARLLGRGPKRLGILRHEIDLRPAAAGRESEERDEVDATRLERREDPLNLSRRVRDRHVLVLDASRGIGYQGPPPCLELCPS